MYRFRCTLTNRGPNLTSLNFKTKLEIICKERYTKSLKSRWTWTGPKHLILLDRRQENTLINAFFHSMYIDNCILSHHTKHISPNRFLFSEENMDVEKEPEEHNESFKVKIMCENTTWYLAQFLENKCLGIFINETRTQPRDRTRKSFQTWTKFIVIFIFLIGATPRKA